MNIDYREHLEDVTALFFRAWSIWGAMDGANTKEKAHLEEALGVTLWGDMLMKIDGLRNDGIVPGPNMMEEDREVARIKNRPDYMLPEHLRTQTPEMVWWQLRWRSKRGFVAASFVGSEMYLDNPRFMVMITGKDEDVTEVTVRTSFPKDYTPTFTDLNEALKPYNVSVPAPENPWWWKWDIGEQDWYESVDSDGNAAINDHAVWVWGTTLDRDVKRDMLLEVVKEAGKP